MGQARPEIDHRATQRCPVNGAGPRATLRPGARRATLTLCSTLLLLSLALAAAAAPSLTWRPANNPGFGARANYAVGSLDVFAGQLYAGTWNAGGAQVWRSMDGQAWLPAGGGWSKQQVAILDGQSFAGHFYAATADDSGSGAEIWRTDGATWTPVVNGGFGDTGNRSISALAVFNSQLYAAAGNLTTGAEIWRSATGNAGSWRQVNTDGFGRGVTLEDITLAAVQGQLYAGVSRVLGGTFRAELWRSADGTDWQSVFTDGLGQPANEAVTALAEFSGALYLGLRNETTGGQVWRSADGTQWTPVFTDGLGQPRNSRPHGLLPCGAQLCVVFSQPEGITAGAEVWRSADGVTWEPIATGGWGDGDNRQAAYFNKAAAQFRNDLYIGTVNETDGGQVWATLNKTRQLYLPVATR